MGKSCYFLLCARIYLKGSGEKKGTRIQPLSFNDFSKIYFYKVAV